MGVQGLWKLLESSGKPIPVEKLENKVLSIDNLFEFSDYPNINLAINVSIWLYQIIKGVQESEHSATTNKHLMVMFHRICKLLFYGIKPIFVFDGGVPELKRLTIAQRQTQKSRAKISAGKIKRKVVKNILEQAALKTVMHSGNTPTEEEVISKTVNVLNKESENDLFELPNLPEDFEIKPPEKERPVFNSYKEKTENILLLAVKNQENDFLYTNSAKDKEKSSPAKLNTFSSLQIGELLNGFSEDQKRLAEKRKQQKSKHEMTFNELEIFLNDKSDTSKAIGEFSQKIASDHDTVYYYESDINKAAKSSSSANNDLPKKIKNTDLNSQVKIESKTINQKVPITDAIGSPTLTEDIDEDIFKAFAGDESLEEDRLAWLIFNENKKASKRRSSEFELPNSRCSKTDLMGSEVLTPEDEDISIKNNKAPSRKHSSEHIYITENDKSNDKFLDDFNEDDYLSWISSTEELEKKESSMSYRDVPSTSKCPPMSNDDYSGNKSDYQESSKSVYFMTNTRSYDNPSPPITSESSNASFSENSLEFSSEESLHHKVTEEEIVFDKKITKEQKEKVVPPATVQTNLDNLEIGTTEIKRIPSTSNKKFTSPSKINQSPTKQHKSLDNQTDSVDNAYLLSIQDTLVKQQNDLAGLQRTSDKMATSITQKITSDMKKLLRLFGIPYITAPMEAEAQCVFLEKIGRTEGTVTDDSDVWLFGANVVYKDFFDNQKYVKQFKSIDIKQKFELSQNSFIQLAFLVGSDYTNGIDGIGPVSAIEILSFFESKTKNMDIEEKLLKIKEIANSNSEVHSHIPFIKKLKSTKIGSDFPNKAVINAYLNPNVTESNEKFNWGTPQVESIIQFAQTNFDWDVSKTKSTLAPVLKKVSERTTQKTLDSFVKSLPKLSNPNTGLSKRVSLAVKRMRNEVVSSVETNNQKSDRPKKLSSSTSSNDGTDKKRKKTQK